MRRGRSDGAPAPAGASGWRCSRDVDGAIRAVHRQDPQRVLALGLLLLILVALCDRLSGPDYSFSIFYLVVVVTISAAKPLSGLLVPVALLTSLTWTLVEGLTRFPDTPWLPLLWNATARFGVLYLAGRLVSVVLGAAQQERENSQRDELTGLHNRRGFTSLAQVELARAARSRRPLSAIYLDVDGFKAVNDLQGHAGGDRLLSDIAGTLQSTVRRHDLLARLGGDEFVALLPETDAAAAFAAAQRAVGALDAMCRHQGWPVHFSIGVASFAEAPASLDAVLTEADRLMYLAKQDGRGTGRSTVRTTGGPPAGPLERAG
jgi:diguanylate cyclase (GGDEF)-like protein